MGNLLYDMPFILLMIATLVAGVINIKKLKMDLVSTIE